MNGLIPIAESSDVPLIDKLRYVLKQDIPQLLDEYFMKIDKDIIKSLVFMNYLFVEVFITSSKLIESLGGDPKIILSEYSISDTLISVLSEVKKTKEIINSILEKAVDYRDTVLNSKYNDIISKAQEFVQQNYREQNISLHTVAKAVSVSPNHFSMIFSRETGETFINYVTGVRIERAKVLLKSTVMRTSEIAYEVGYNDAHYFNYVFKKSTGMTPKGFRTINL